METGREGAGRTDAGRRFPSGGRYREALQHPRLCFRDADLQGGTVQQDPVLGPRAISGNFASVFSVTSSGGRRFAVKCFTRDVASQEERYEAVSAHLAKLAGDRLSQPWPVGFAYLREGVVVDGILYPVLKMTWVEGVGLKRWIADHRHDPREVGALAGRFVELTTDLERHGIAHGDLQHGNLLVAPDGTLRLVDYDGMYVPALEGRAATENGHRNYQSPTRGSGDFGPTMDRFSAWVILLALVATAADPGLWDQLHDRDGEFLLLSERDFTEPAGSLAWSTLLTHPDSTVHELALRVRGHLAIPPASVPALASWVQAPAAPGSAGLPAWMAGRVAPTVTATMRGSAGFVGRRFADVVVAVVALLLVVAAIAVPIVAALPASMAATAAAALLTTAFTVSAAGRRRRPEAVAARARIRRLRGQVIAQRGVAASVIRLDTRAASVESKAASHEKATTRTLQSLRAQEIRELATIEAALDLRRQAARRGLDALDARESDLLLREAANRLAEHIRGKLRTTSIREARRLSNMGDKTVQALVDAGIHTPADFTAVSYATSGYGSMTATFRLANGRQVRVPGIGQARAQALEAWREHLVTLARATAPTALPGVVQAGIRKGIATERATLESGAGRAEAVATTARAELAIRIEAARGAATQAQAVHRTETLAARSLILDERRRSQASVALLERARADLARERSARRATLGRRRYAAFALRGR